jgi:hypothetical protein
MNLTTNSPRLADLGLTAASGPGSWGEVHDEIAMCFLGFFLAFNFAATGKRGEENLPHE